MSATQWKVSFVTQKGSNFTLKESIAYPKRDYTSHLCTKEWETTHQLNTCLSYPTAALVSCPAPCCLL